MQFVKGIFNTKAVNAFYAKCAKVKIADVGYKPQLNDKFVLFESQTQILFKADDGIVAENIIIDDSNKQRYIVVAIDQQLVPFSVTVDGKEENIQCKRATIKKYLPPM